jgi:hypothetical protein
MASGAQPKGLVKILTNILSHPFLFKSAMHSKMNPLFELDQGYIFFGSSEERMAFYSDKLSFLVLMISEAVISYHFVLGLASNTFDFFRSHLLINDCVSIQMQPSFARVQKNLGYKCIAWL